ncbi:hypothetical protein TNCV_1924501 [Trichonephila clavipes]|nr:hypothetical protein TNCV_1924501 [Trichonephila clavipes]
MVLHLGGKFLSFLAWLRAKRLLSDWMLGTVNIDSDWLPRGLNKNLVKLLRSKQQCLNRLCVIGPEAIKGSANLLSFHLTPAAQRGPIHVKSVKVKLSPVGVEIRRGVAAQVSSSSLDHG